MSKKDKKIFQAEEASKRRKERNCTPPDNRGDNYVTGQEKLRTQGKGSKYRVIKGWYSDEMTNRFNKIFGRMQNDADKLQEEYKKNTTATPIPKFDKDE